MLILLIKVWSCGRKKVKQTPQCFLNLGIFKQKLAMGVAFLLSCIMTLLGYMVSFIPVTIIVCVYCI